MGKKSAFGDKELPLMGSAPGTPLLGDVGHLHSDDTYRELGSSDGNPSEFRLRVSDSNERATSKSYSISGVTGYDPNKLILKANLPPKRQGASLQEILNNIKKRKYYLAQFGSIQDQTGMNPFSLRFSEEYEAEYLEFTQLHALKRVRYCFVIGLISVLCYATYEALYTWNDLPISEESLTGLYVILYGIAAPMLLIGILSTFFRQCTQHIENITWVVFFVAGVALIVEKPLDRSKGPVLPLFIVLIPIFGITRMRFTKSLVLGMTLFFLYIAVQLGFSNDVAGSIIYQGVNYLIGVIGGGVSHYRQELLRRRNFALQLPFGGLQTDASRESRREQNKSDINFSETSVSEELHGEKFSKHNLLHPWTRKFRNDEVENTFYRYWYLIDPFPYEHPNAGILHKSVFRVIRFAIMGLVLNQTVLGIQDYRFLRDDGQKHLLAAIIRYGIVVPCYVSAGVFMYYMGEAFYRHWVKEAEAAEAQMFAANDGIMPKLANEQPIDTDTLDVNEISIVAEKTNEQLPNGNLPPQAIANKKNSETYVERVFDKIVARGSYVRYAQFYAAGVVAIHGAAMGALLLVADEAKDPQPVYYMGLLNALLFAHRSGFRVRFIYATAATTLVSIVFIIAAYFIRRKQFVEYSSYVVVVLSLAMMISYEEESLRRTFFVIKSIRILEFDEWFTTVLRIQGWVRKKLESRVASARAKISKRNGNPVHGLTEVQGKMGQASRYGVMTQAANVALGAITELV